jgi:hypothetical protein
MSLPLIHGLHEERHQDASVLTPDPVIILFGTIQTPDFLIHLGGLSVDPISTKQCRIYYSTGPFIVPGFSWE